MTDHADICVNVHKDTDGRFNNRGGDYPRGLFLRDRTFLIGVVRVYVGKGRLFFLDLVSGKETANEIKGVEHSGDADKCVHGK